MIEQEPPPRNDAVEAGNRLDAVIAAYLEARDEGRSLDRRVLLAQHPEFANELTRFFEGNDRVEWLVTSVVPAVPSEGARFGPYRVIRLISRGGMGVVYEAEDPAACRVALKVLPTFGLPDPREHERFRREITLAARLNHPHIVPILDFGTFGGIPYCAMELIEGKDLRTLIRSLRRRDSPTSSPAVEDFARSAIFEAIASSDKAQPAETRPEYFRFVARVGAEAARALAYAHSMGIWHRDVKPSNLLLDGQGKIHVADFGLAKSEENPDLTETGDLAGTLRYLAPERLEGWCGPWSDVYSLGLTLYELLVLRPAFENLDRSRLIRAITRDHPRRPRAINRATPRDLEIIVRRATEKEPGHRYPTAAALADDLERFLIGRPILGRPVARWRRALTWARRNPGTAAIQAAGMMISAVSLGAIFFGLTMSRDAAEARATVAQAQRTAAEMGRRESQYQSLVLQIQQIHLLPHSAAMPGPVVPAGPNLGAGGWSARAWDLVRQAAAVRADAQLRDQAAATLVGIDARLSKQLCGLRVSSVAFDSDGKRLLIGGVEPDQMQDGRAKLLDLAGDQAPVSCGLPGPGPVTFRNDGTPIQLVVRPEGRLELWNIDGRCAIRQFDFPNGATLGRVAMRSGGSAVAVSVTLTDRREMVLVWDVEQIPPRHQFVCKATALAFSDDGALLAAGDEDGRIQVWNLATGNPIAEIRQGRNTIHCFSFTRNPERDAKGERGWLLGVGDSGGSIVVWDLATKLSISRCNGSSYDVYSLAFSPDGTTLGSAGRTGVATILWDWATGRNLLSVELGSSHPSLAFSPDGARLAVGVDFLSLDSSQVVIWDLDHGRGIRTLRGLTSPIQWVLFSPDRRRIAALAHDWRLGIWDLASGRLEAILRAPRGFTTDNAGIAFRGDGRQLAVSAGRQASLWDLAPLREVQTWSLPPGLVERIAFPSAEQLILFRYESLDGIKAPFGNDFRTDPNVCRIRNLLGPEPLKPQAEYRGFNRRLFEAVASPDGRFFLLNGWHDHTDGDYVGIQALGASRGEDFWSIRWQAEKGGHAGLAIDPQSNRFVTMSHPGGHPKSSLRDVATGAELRSFDEWPGIPAPDLKYFVKPNGQGISLRIVDEPTPLNLGIDAGFASISALGFTTDGAKVAWGNLDGSVMVADLVELRSRLAQAGLSW